MTKIRNQPAAAQQIRCAIYTRKSTDEGLEKEFNSLDAQRESGEAYVASQQHEGWTCVPDRYDDGGFTGGNMDRPALKRLMADIEAGKIDSVIVYKVDRLSRSLLDFAKIVETFDRHHISFVSVTQLINTATSMGRLMLNVLLSFAQFEREIISERTRDKIAAARRKGKWSGGMPLLGYDVDPLESKLLINEDEAARVRTIFELYLEHQSMITTIKELDRRGWVNKRWTTRKGHERGGKQFTKTSLYKLLTNVTYAGKIKYKDEIHNGEHAAVVNADLWQRVQALLNRNGRTGGARCGTNSARCSRACCGVYLAAAACRQRTPHGMAPSGTATTSATRLRNAVGTTALQNRSRRPRSNGSWWNRSNALGGTRRCSARSSPRPAAKARPNWPNWKRNDAASNASWGGGTPRSASCWNRSPRATPIRRPLPVWPTFKSGSAGRSAVPPKSASKFWRRAATWLTSARSPRRCRSSTRCGTRSRPANRPAGTGHRAQVQRRPPDHAGAGRPNAHHPGHSRRSGTVPTGRGPPEHL